jgi:hypothetical protein
LVLPLEPQPLSHLPVYMVEANLMNPFVGTRSWASSLRHLITPSRELRPAALSTSGFVFGFLVIVNFNQIPKFTNDLTQPNHNQHQCADVENHDDGARGIREHQK